MQFLINQIYLNEVSSMTLVAILTPYNSGGGNGGSGGGGNGGGGGGNGGGGGGSGGGGTCGCNCSTIRPLNSTV